MKTSLLRLPPRSNRSGDADPVKSYVATLFAKGDDAIIKKIGEEATETVMAAKDGDKMRLSVRDCRPLVSLPGPAGAARHGTATTCSPSSSGARACPGIDEKAARLDVRRRRDVRR